MNTPFENEGYFLDKPFYSHLTGKRIQTFSEFVLFFKSFLRINDDNPLKELLIKRNQDHKFNESADIIFNDKRFKKNLNLYTDVDTLLTLYSKVVRSMINIHRERGLEGKPKIKISYYNEESEFSSNKKCVILSIHHLNSTFKKTKEDTIEKPFGETAEMLEKQINGLSDYYLQAEFEDEGPGLINLWNGRGRVVKEVSSGFEGGVELLMKFEKEPKN